MWEVDQTLLRSEVFPLFKVYIEEHNTARSIFPHFVLHQYSSKKEGKTSANEALEEANFVDTVWEGVQGDDAIASLLTYLSAHFLVPPPKKRRMVNSILKKVSPGYLSLTTVTRLYWNKRKSVRKVARGHYRFVHQYKQR